MSVIRRAPEVRGVPSAQLLITGISFQHNAHKNVRAGWVAGDGLWGDLPRGPASGGAGRRSGRVA